MLTRRQFAAGVAAAGLALPAAARAAAGPIPRMRRGINLHNLLNWPEAKTTDGQTTYSWPAFAGPRYAISDAELRTLVGIGFDFVRLTVDPSIFIVARDDHAREIRHHALGVVQQILHAGLNVVFDLHSVAVNPAYTPEVLVQDINSPAFAAYVECVGSMATLLRDQPPDRVALELMNEPRIYGTGRSDTARWQAMLERLHAAARAAAPSLPLVLTGAEVSDARALMLLDLAPFQGSNVLYTFHFYEPYAFTHQSVPGIAPRCIAGLTWPEDSANTEGVLAQAQQCVAALPGSDDDRRRAADDTMRLLRGYQRHNFSERDVATLFDKVGRWAADASIDPARVLLGEFGCAWGTADHAADAPRLAWLRSVVSNAERNRFPWAYWAYKGQRGMTLVEENTTTLDPEIVAILKG